MTESDDPVTIAVIAGGAAVGAAAGGAFSKKPKVPTQAAPTGTATAAKTAEALPQGSETAIKNRRKKASLLTRDFPEPTLGQPGILGAA